MNNQKNEVIQMSDNLAYIFFQNKLFELAHQQSKITLSLEPLNPNAHFNAARCCYYVSKYDKAIEHVKIAMMLDGNNIEGYKRELALYLPWVGEDKAAIEILKSLPQDPRTKFNLGWYALKQNNIKEGFKLLENGRLINCWGSKTDLPIPKWDGSDIRGKKLLIVNEGGVGDEIIFFRFALQLRDHGVNVSILPTQPLFPVFSRTPGINLETSMDNYKNYDFWVPSMSLPFVMKTEKISGSPYLQPNQSYVDKWKKKIDTQNLNIGVRWQGGKLYEHDQRRTLPADYLANNIKRRYPSFNFYSLQKESDEKCPEEFINLENELQSWEDTIAVISLMDVVITSCTSIAHIAGALGKKTFVIIPIVSYFTWAKDGNKTDWYDTVTLFRQPNPYFWNVPIDQAVDQLEQIKKS